MDAEQSTPVDRIQHGDALRLVLESELNPRVFVSPVRDTAGVLVDFRCIEVNRAALRELHADGQDLIGKPIRDLHPSFASELFDLYAQTIETGEALAIDDLAVSHAWLDLRAVRVGDLLSVTWRDVSDRHWGQAVEDEQWYRLLIENSGDVLVRADNQGVLRWVSDSVRDRLGWEPDDLVGTPITELIHPDHMPALQRAQLALLDGEEQRVQLSIRLRDGQWRTFATLIRPQRDSSGTVVGWIASWRDIHDEHSAREQLLQSQTRYRLIAENAADVVMLLDTHANVTWLSPSAQRLTGWPAEGLTGAEGRRLVHPADWPSVSEALADVKEGSEKHALVARFRTPQGDYEYWHLDLRHIRGTPGITMVLTMHNVDKEFRAEREAKAAHARRRAVLDSMLDPHVLLEAVRDQAHTIVDFLYADANDAACAYLSMDRDALLGSTLLTLLPGHRGSELFESYVRAVETGSPLILDDFVYPHDIFAESRHYDIRAIKINDGLSFTWRDITDRTELSKQLASSEQRFRLIATSTRDIIAVGTTDRVLEWVSPSLTRALGWLPEQWVGHSPHEFFHPEDIAAINTAEVELIDGQPTALRVRLLAADGTYHWSESHSSPLTDDEGNILGIMAIMTIIDDRVAWEETLQHRASHDPLTGLLTREEGYRRLATMLGHEPRTGVRTFLAFVDMDDMKAVNDTLGHAAGDELLRVTAQRIRKLLRDGDHVARIGGDEMLLILTGIQHTEAAVTLMTKLLKAVNAPVHYHAGDTLHPRLSIGLTEITPDDDIEESVHRGDQAMYQAKAAGGNQIRVAERPSR